MTTTKLHIAPSLSLPLAALMKKHVILGQSGTGKTNAGVVLVEEFARANLPFVIVDGLGVWWGLRSSRDGNSSGLSVVILGGEKGDMSLEPTAGAVIADFVVSSGMSFVLDLSLMRRGQAVQFMHDFSVRLFEAKATNKAPLHLMVDEADQWAPQETKDGGLLPKLVGAMEDLVRRGRSRGVGMTMITQRPAVLNKSCISQADVLHIFRLASPQDRKALDEWVKANATKDQLEHFTRELPELSTGHCFVWSPAWLNLFRRVHVRERTTFDSSATPEVGVKARAPKVMSKVDIEALRAKVAATIEATKAEDPKTLRAQIAALQAQLSTQKEVVTNVEIPVLEKETADALRSFVEDFEPLVADMRSLVEQVKAGLDRLPGGVPPRARIQPVIETVAVTRNTRPGELVARPAKPIPAPDGWTPGKCERALLRVLAARSPEPTNLAQLAILSGYSIKSSSLANALGALRSRGFASAGQPIFITKEGRALAGDVEPLPSGRALLGHWCAQLGKAEAALLTTIFDAHPRELARERLSEITGYSITSSSFANALGKLRTLELVEKGSTRLGAALAEAK